MPELFTHDHKDSSKTFNKDYLSPYTEEYHKEHSKWDALRRNWTCDFDGVNFLLTNNNNEVTPVFFDGDIVSCACDDYFEKQTGTCIHGEILKFHRNKIKEQIKISKKINNACGIHVKEKIEIWTEGDGSIILPGVERFKNIKQLEYNETEYENVNVIPNITMREYQEESIRKMLRVKKCVLTLKVGLGKTLCAIACLKIIKPKKTLIICPTPLKPQWEKEIKKHLGVSPKVAYKSSDLIEDSNLLIINYELLARNPHIIDSADCCIIDEIQRIRNKDTKTWQKLSAIKSEWIFALSGTVIENTVEDLINIIEIIDSNAITPTWKFYGNFCNVRKGKVRGFQASKITDLKKYLDRYIVNPKVDISTFPLPKKKEQTHLVSMDLENKPIHDDAFDSAKMLMAKSIDRALSFQEQIALQGFLMRARIASNGKSKVDKIIELINQTEGKIVVYSEWIKMLELIAKRLDKYVMYHGQITQKQRFKNFNSFLEKDDIKVFLSTDSGGVGVDGLQIVANNVIHTEAVWNPAKFEQRNGRVVRPLSSFENVDVHYVFSDKGVETMMTEGLDRKLNYRLSFLT